MDEQGYELAGKKFHEFLDKIGSNYMDLVLIHWPGAEWIEDNSQ